MSKKNSQHDYENALIGDDVSLLTIFQILKGHGKVIGGVFFLSLLLAIGLASFSKNVYRVDFLIEIPYRFIMSEPYKETEQAAIAKQALVSFAETKALIDVVNLYFAEGHFNQLTQKLGVSSEVCQKLVSLKLQPMKDQSTVVNMEIRAYDTQSAIVLGKGIVKYLNENELVVSRLSLQNEHLNKLKTAFQESLKGSEKMYDLIANKLKKNEGNLLAFNPVDMESKIISLKEKLSTIEFSEKTTTGFTLAIEPVVSSSPVPPKRGGLLLLICLAGLGIGIVIAFFLEWLTVMKLRHAREKVYKEA